MIKSIFFDKNSSDHCIFIFKEIILQEKESVMMRRYWVCNAAQEHVHIVRDKGYTQVNMGPREPLEKMNVGDWILYYSPTIYFQQSKPACCKFTGISCVTGKRTYPQSNQNPDHWRRNVEFFNCIAQHPKHFVGKVNFLPQD